MGLLKPVFCREPTHQLASLGASQTEIEAPALEWDVAPLAPG